MPNETPQPRPSRGLSVLIVEDEFLIALDLQMMLEDAGHSVLGPAGTVAAALRLLEGTPPDVATLDLNLRGQLVVPVAVRLRDLQIPFVLASAYASRGFDGSEALAGAENVGKPIHPRRLLDALGRAVGSA
ncbi:response regulator (plasmid) [Cereibacter azotoformans]|uniref:response regulator n=1 Tax=Cereibacter azotoformans TaxID=43057 RepID=UPI001EEA30A8|nr:response regulator [Cereibacter azotoformans]ULB12456.1 response regulator [Cereibacter azotoformans]